MKLIFLLLTFCLLTSASAWNPPASQTQSPDLTGLNQLSQSMQTLTSRIEGAVVQIFSTRFRLPENPVMGAASLLTQERSSGSGVFVSPDGHIVTNAHVVQNARQIQVLIQEGAKRGRSILGEQGTLVEAQLVGTDQETDLAVLKVDGKEHPHLEFADSDTLRKGEIVLAFGSPRGLENSVTLGIVSSVARQLRPDDPMIYIQTDAPINPGNSGGPLINTSGQIVGINTLILSESGGSEGIGFSAPSNIVSHVYEQILKNGFVRRSELGINLQTLSHTLATGLGLERNEGAVISDVLPGSPASLAGLEIGDIVLRMGDKIIENARQLEVNIYSKTPGESVRLQVLRGKEVLNLTSQVRERQDKLSKLAQMVTPEKNLIPELGILALDIGVEVAEFLPTPRKLGGALVAARAVNGPFRGLGLLPGDVIFEVNGQQITNLRTLKEALEQFNSNDPVVLQVQRQGTLLYVTLVLD